MARSTRPQLLFRLSVSIVVWTFLLAVLLFAPAGTLAWWRAWVFMALSFAGMVAGSLSILNVSEGLVEERLKSPIQKDQSLLDKILVSALIAGYVGQLIFIPVDVFRLHLLPKPDLAASSAGLALYFVGWWIADRALRGNAFAALVVRYQEERKHVVVDTGPYRVVRHPMYAGAVLVFLGLPLWLESYAAATLTIILLGILVARILEEEQYLRGHLPGYAAYTERVRYRLVPFLW